jgi:tRNA 2-selenouridine synthase
MRGSSGALRTPPRLRVLCGPAGTGKTELLRALQARGAQVLDLEFLARHRGSAFGTQKESQPSPDHFRRSLARTLAGADPHRVLWLEHETAYLGRVWLPDDLQRHMSEADGVLLSVSRERRVARLLAEYGTLSAATLLDGVARLAPRLGAARAEELRVLIETTQLARTAALLLDYYDALYAHQLSRRAGRVVTTINVGERSVDEIAEELMTGCLEAPLDRRAGSAATRGM